MKELEEKVRAYVTRRGYKPQNDKIVYCGIRHELELPDGTKKDLHQFSFLISAGEGYEIRPWYIFADESTKRIVMLLTPHFFEMIEE